MIKVLAYGVRQDEEELFKYWANEYGIQVELLPEILTAKNLHLAKGYQYISFLNEDELHREHLVILKSYGVRLLSSRIVGLDNVDLSAAKDLGLAVSHVPAYSPHSVSEFTLLSTLTLLRNYRAVALRNIHGDFRTETLIGREIRNMVVGVIGAGRIGSLTVRHFAGFKPKKILINDPLPKEELREFGEYTKKETIYQEADIIAYHVPLKEDTKYLINAQTIAQMKAGVLIINPARGGIMDAQAILDGLNSGLVGGAALDVYELETGYFRFDWSNTPIPDAVLRGLVSHPRCLISPHIAFYTDEAVSNMVSICLGNVKAFEESGDCPHRAV